MMRALVLALLLLGCDGDDGSDTPRPRPVASNPATEWQIGPITSNGGNYSEGVPLNPERVGAGFAFDIPYPNRMAGHVHYITKKASLTGKTRIVMRYRVDMAEGVQLVPTKEQPGPPSMLTLYFQRRGDNWSGSGDYEDYRWYATFSTHMPVTAGEHEIAAPLDGNWTAVMTSSALTNPSGFRDAVANAERVGFVLGGGDGYGHGVYSTGPARFTVTHFGVE